MDTLKQNKQTEAFEALLLSHVETCYAVALALTHNLNDAHDLTREVFEWAWNFTDRAEAEKNIKTKLFIMTRRKFIEGYRRPRKSNVKHATMAERI